MATNLYTAQLDLLTVDDVHNFLDLNLEEGPRLDYKQADRSTEGIPDSTLETIVAFANTYGGLLILGVSADKTTNRPTKRDGLILRLKASIEEQLTSRCYAAIQPPIMPEIRVCTFKSDPEQMADDRAFVVVRVAPSAAAPHATKENQIYIRAGSETRLADLTVLRALFERQQLRDQRLAELAAFVRMRGEAVYRRYAPEWQGATPYAARWRQRWPAIIAEFIPLDAPTQLLSFVPRGDSETFPDDRIKRLLTSEGWTMAHDVMQDKPDDMLRQPEGLGIVAPFTSNIQSYTEEEFRSLAPTIWYIDCSGGAIVVLPEAGLRWPSTIELPSRVHNEPSQVTPLLYQLCGMTRVFGSLLSERGYAGRIQATVWYWFGQDQPFEYGIVQSHHGQVVLAMGDPWETRSLHLASLVSQLTRSWLEFPFSLQTWPESDIPVLREGTA